MGSEEQFAFNIDFFDFFRDHAEWLVDVLLPQGERSQTYRCLCFFQSVLLSHRQRDIYTVNGIYMEYIHYNLQYIEDTGL